MTLHADDRQLSQLIDGDLSHVAQEAVRLHLTHCIVCAWRHDELVGVVTALRMQPAARWSPELALRSVQAISEQEATSGPHLRVGTFRRRARWNRSFTLPLATTLLAVALFVAALLIPIVRSGVAIAHSSFETLGNFAPAPLSVPPSGSLIGLLVLAVVCPWLSLRLARRR